MDMNTSVDTLRSATVVSSDGSKIGKVGEVYLGDQSDKPEWVTVKTGLFGTAETFVPLAEADMHGDELRVPYGKDQVKDAPRTEADGQLSVEEEDNLFAYYGLSGSTTGTTTTSGTTTNGTTSTRDSVDGFTDEAGTSRDDYEALAAGGTMTDGRTTTDDRMMTGGTTGRGDSRADLAGRSGIEGRDTSGPTTDEAMTRSEERLQVGTEHREAGRARLRKHIVSERQTAQVGTSHEELTIEREPITDANRGAATSGAQLSEEEHEVVLHEEVPVVSTTVEPVERVRLGTQTEHDTQSVSADVRKEEIEVDRDAALDLDAGRERAATGRDRT